MDSTGLDTIFSLRKKLNVLEKEKLDAVAACNQEIGELTTNTVRLGSLLEKGEVVKQNLEYELAKTMKYLATERQSAVNREAQLMESVTELKRKLNEMTNQMEMLAQELASTREQNGKEIARLVSVKEDKETVISEYADRVATFETAGLNFQMMLTEKQRIIENLQTEICRLQDSNSQLTEDIEKQRQESKLLKDRASQGNVNLNDAFRQVQRLEEAIEAEMNTQNHAKFCSDLIQLRIRDLESAVEVERAAKGEAFADVRRLSENISELQKAFDDQKTEITTLQSKLSRSQKELEMHNRQHSEKKLLVESLSEQLKQQCCDLKQLKVELTKAKKRQFRLDEAYISAVSELRLVLSPSDNQGGADNFSQFRSGDMVSSKTLSRVVKGVRELVQSYWKSNSALTTTVSCQKRQIMKLTKDLKEWKEKFSERGRSLEEAESSLKQHIANAHRSNNERNRIKRENSELNKELQRLKEGLVHQQTQSQQLRDQMLNVSLKYKTDEQTSTAFLVLLHQQLNSALLTGGLAIDSLNSVTRLASEHCDWSDIALVVNEQVSLLVTQHNRAQDRVNELERLVTQQNDAINLLETAHSNKLQQLSKMFDEQNQQWSIEKSELLQSYHHMIVDQTKHMHSHRQLGTANKKNRRVNAAHRSRSVDPPSPDRNIESDCLLAAVTLLYCDLTTVSRRVSELVSQRSLLLVEVDKLSRFKREIAGLVTAMTFDDSSPAVHVVDSYRLALRFRVAAIAVIAANRLVRRSSSGMNVGRSDWLENYREMNLTQRTELCDSIVTSVSDLQRLIQGVTNNNTSSSSENVKSIHQKCLGALHSSMSSLLPSGGLGKEQLSSLNYLPLSCRLNSGLQHVFMKTVSDVYEMHPYARCDEILERLQHCVLDFTNRLHSAQIDRNHLRHANDILKKSTARRSDSSEKYNGLLVQLTQALEREQTMQELIEEQSSRLQQLNVLLQTNHFFIANSNLLPEKVTPVLSSNENKLEELLQQIRSLEREKEVLKENINDAEVALRTSTRDKQALAGYLSSVKATLGSAEGMKWPANYILPVEIGLPSSSDSSRRRNSNLAAVRALVISFVKAHNELVERFSEAQNEIHNLKQNSETRTRLDQNGMLISVEPPVVVNRIVEPSSALSSLASDGFAMKNRIDDYLKSSSSIKPIKKRAYYHYSCCGLNKVEQRQAKLLLDWVTARIHKKLMYLHLNSHTALTDVNNGKQPKPK